MYAVIVSGGKQHRVEEGETLKLEKLNMFGYEWSSRLACVLDCWVRDEANLYHWIDFPSYHVVC